MDVLNFTLDNFERFLFVFLRVLGILVIAPIFGHRSVVNQVKVGLALMVAVALFPVVPTTLTPQPHMILLVLAIIKELLMGLLIGFVSMLVFMAVKFAGELIGLEVNSFFTPADTLDAVRNAGSAELNIVVSDIYGQGGATLFEERHGTPFITVPLPVGVSASEAFLNQVAAALSLDGELVKEVIAREKKHYYQILEPLTDCYNDLDLQRYAVVVGDGNYAVALTRFLSDDLGWLPVLTVVTDKVKEEEQPRLAKRVADLASGFTTDLVFESDASEVLGHLNRVWPRSSGEKYHNAFSPAFVVGSSLDRELAQSIGAPHLSVSFPVANRAVLDRGYTGFRGGLRLAEDLFSAIVVNR